VRDFKILNAPYLMNEFSQCVIISDFARKKGAIAAGNCVILKPSEVANHSAKLMSELIPKYLDNVIF
jgi:hypothetical protein